MRLFQLVAHVMRPQQVKTSAAGPMIAWSHVGAPQWTPRRMTNLAEEGFRKNVIAYRCVMQIATAAAAVPWLLYDNEGSELAAHPILDLLSHPNPLQDGVTFMESLYANLQIFGNAYVEAIRPNGAQAPVELYALRPDRMKVIPGATGLPQGYQYAVNGQTTTWPCDALSGASNILHIKQFHPLDEVQELYEADIMNGSTVLRAFTGLTSPMATYTAAQQTNDWGGSIPSTFSVNIYQVSSRYGNGNAALAVI